MKAAGRSPRHRPLSPASDTSSGLGTPVGSDSEESSSGVEDTVLPLQPSTRKVSFRENGFVSGHSSSQNHARPSYMESPFDAAAQIAHPVTSSSEGQGPLDVSKGPAPQGAVHRAASLVKLPRADVLVIGGDLAYPNPSNETYEQRFFRPFEAALPPPPHVRPGRLVVYKPDLPGAADLRHASSSQAQPDATGGTPQNASRYVTLCPLLLVIESG